MQMLLGTQVRKRTGAQKENWCKSKLAVYMTVEAMATCLEESSTGSTNSVTWRAGGVKTSHLSSEQKSYDNNC